MKKINWNLKREAKFNAIIEEMFVKDILKNTKYNFMKSYKTGSNKSFNWKFFLKGYFGWNHIETQSFIVCHCVSVDSLSEV